MARNVKIDGVPTREKYSYLAYPRDMDRTFRAMILEDAGKYAIENHKDLMKNILMEAIVYWERTNRRFIEARDWSAANALKMRFADVNANNYEEKLGIGYSKIMEEDEEYHTKQLDKIRQFKKLRDKKPPKV